MPQSLTDPSFPAEILLEVIQYVPFEGYAVRNLALAHSRFYSLLRIYECSVTKNFARRQLRHAMTDFPCTEESGVNYAWLAQCIRQYDVVDEVMAALDSRLNCYALEKHNMALANAGLLLLYRLHCLGDAYAEKLAFVKSLPKDPLKAIFLAVHYSTLTARYHGNGIISQTSYGRFMDANQLALRTEVEVCFAEGVMNLGPEFIGDVFEHRERGETNLMCLYHEYAVHDWDTTQEGDFTPPITYGPEQSPDAKSQTLWTALLERMAVLVECPLQEVVDVITEDIVTPDHSLAWLSLAGKARLVKGLNL